jgi:O-antigen/teichoic acid export membrane protein
MRIETPDGQSGIELQGGRARAAAFYVLTVVFDKGLALLTIPVAAAYLSPSEFGRMEVAISLIELAGLAFALGLGECLLRFASSAGSLEAKSRVAAELLGTAIIASVGLGIALQLVAPAIMSALSINVDLVAMRLALAAASLTALIQLPVMWWRLEANSKAVFVYAFLRSLTQLSVLWLVFHNGYGAEGALIGNAIVMATCAVILGILYYRTHGIAFTARGLRNVALYGSPLVASGFATFAIGSMNRWFLSGNVADAEIAHLALAMKLALATALVLQPFSLWWIGRRMAVLSEANGVERSAAAWGWGVVVLVIGATVVQLSAPIFIELALPAGYHAAAPLLAFAIMVSVLNELCTLSNVGSHLRRTGFSVMAINIAGAIVAVTGYVILVPMMGVLGALGAMMAGHAVRLLLFLYDGHKIAPISYPIGRAACLAGLAVGVCAFAPEPHLVVDRGVWAIAASLALIAGAGALRLLPIAEALRRLMVPLRRSEPANV